MKKSESSKTEYSAAWETGTYQTGNTTPPKKSNPLVAVLLMVVIFLGGIASALGIINLRLLAALQQTPPAETLPLHLQQGSKDTVSSDSAGLESIPSVPQRDISMDLADPEEAGTGWQTDAFPQACVVRITVDESTQGYGLVLSQDGFILTFSHLLDRAERVFVQLPNGTVNRAAIVGTDAYTDLAVLYIQAEGLTPAVFSGVEMPAPGSKVSALCGQSISGGTVFAAENTLEIGKTSLSMLKTSAATGKEAGFLLGSGNQVLGIISPRLADFLCCEGEDLAYVIPASAMKTVVDQLLHRGFAAGRPCIGASVEEVTDVYQNYWKLPDGLRITGVSNSVLQEGDILIRIGSSPITTLDRLYKALFPLEIGEAVDVTVYRQGKEITLSLYLGEAGE